MTGELVTVKHPIKIMRLGDIIHHKVELVYHMNDDSPMTEWDNARTVILYGDFIVKDIGVWVNIEERESGFFYDDYRVKTLEELKPEYHKYFIEKVEKALKENFSLPELRQAYRTWYNKELEYLTDLREKLYRDFIDSAKHYQETEVSDVV